MSTRQLSLGFRSHHSMKFLPILGSLSLVLLILLVFPGVSTEQTPGDPPPVAQCTLSGSDCAIPEDIDLLFPQGFRAVSGDVVLAPTLNSSLPAVSDVLHIHNDFIDTGLGTGIGISVRLFSGHNGTLPSPLTYSANALEIRENPEGHGDTQYLGNGTDYHLETGVLSNRGGSKASAPAQNAMLDLATGAVAVAASSGKAVGQGPEQDPGQADGLPFYTANYAALGGKQIPFNIVGSNPANGAATTTIPTVIVPIKVVYQLARGLALDGTKVVPAVQNSPIFQVADYTVGGTDLGVTQFGDALQRGEFHNLPGFSPDYHVLLGTPAIAPTLTVTVTSSSQGNLFSLRSGGLIGIVAEGFFNRQLVAQLPQFTADTLPIFLVDNVFESATGTIDNTCCVLGFHSSQQPPASTAKTWIYAAHTESGTFVNNVILDVQPLSHEVSEWLNDPFVGKLAVGFVNLIPPAVLPGTGGGCILNFETGDPLEAPPAVFTKVTNGTTYHLQDEVFLPWYLHTSPSFSVNGQYSFQNTFTSFSSLCGPG